MPIDGKHSSGSEYRNSRPPGRPQILEQQVAQGPVIFMKPQISTPSPHNTDVLTFFTRDKTSKALSPPGGVAQPRRRHLCQGHSPKALGTAATRSLALPTATTRGAHPLAGNVSQQLPAVRGTKGSGCRPSLSRALCAATRAGRPGAALGEGTRLTRRCVVLVFRLHGAHARTLTFCGLASMSMH